MARTIAHFLPARLLLVLILCAIGFGTILLKLPFSYYGSLSWIDALFTAASCLCTGGLMTVSTDIFSPIGQVIILGLIQIGGLGLVAFIIFFMSFFIKFGFTTQVVAGQMMELDSWKELKKLIFFIMGFTAFVELLGACINFFSIYPEYSFGRSIFLSIFNVVTHFCHAGISLFPQGMIGYKTNWIMLLCNAFIMIAGGLGFITWYEFFKFFKNYRKEKRLHFSLQTKIVLYGTFFIILASSALFGILEYNNTLYSLSPFLTIINSFYNGVAMRGTGFSTVPTEYLHLATFLLIMVIAFIGSAPGSTGSGIKITTFAIVVTTVKAALSGRPSISIFGRSIAKDQTLKAISLVFLALGWIVCSTFILLITEKSGSFLDIFFESVSAFATLGLSTGITPFLSVSGKLCIIMNMIVGRVGAFSLVLALYKRHKKPEFSYPEERVMLG